MMYILRLAVLLVPGFFVHPLCAADSPPIVEFHEFVYEGKDPVFSAPLKANDFQNPILAGFYPDPSITRAGDDYYLVTSSFAYSPGVPIFHSKDLVHWNSLGHVLTTAEQLPLKNQSSSRGIYAPTIRFHKGVFYLVTTLVDIRGNFIVTAKNPAGPWSAPVLLPEVGGIDPDLFFDDDGRAYIAHNDAPPGQPLYEGHRAIWLWEYDLEQQKVVKDSHRLLVNGGTNINEKPVWIEGPHLYKINGWYYLLCAQGGTSDNHSEVVFRSKSLTQPFEPFSGNPILTQRNLNPQRTNPITSSGHADLIQTTEGEWWAVFLATRPYAPQLYNTGRETFLLPVQWRDGWPIILPHGESIPLRLPAPKTHQVTQAPPTTGNFVWRDSFDSSTLNHHWVQRGADATPFFALDASGNLLLTARSSRIDMMQPAFLGRRQQHAHFIATTAFAAPAAPIAAGLAVVQNETAHYFFAVQATASGYNWFIEQADQAAPRIIQRGRLRGIKSPDEIILGVEIDGAAIRFFSRDKKGKARTLFANADATLLSTHKAGGFVGTMVGLHARLNQAQ